MNMRSNTAMWDFWSLSPESLHQVSILMSDRGLPVVPMYMNGYGSHTYSFWNDKGERFGVKFHFKTLQGYRHYTNEEAKSVVGENRESYQEELFGTIERGEFPRWKLQVQIMPEKDVKKTLYNPFDLTKVWPYADYPPIDIGVLELNRNADNYFTQIEQAAFSPSNIVPGISFSPDKMLQARIFSYVDTHRYRLGGNYEHIPVNKPISTVYHYHRDGQMNTVGGLQSGNAEAYYEPNSFEAPFEYKTAQEQPLKISGDADHYDHRVDNDDYIQVRDLFNLFDEGEKARLFNNYTDAMKGVPDDIIERQLGHLAKVHVDFEQGVRLALQTKYNYGKHRNDV